MTGFRIWWTRSGQLNSELQHLEVSSSCAHLPCGLPGASGLGVELSRGLGRFCSCIVSPTGQRCIDKGVRVLDTCIQDYIHRTDVLASCKDVTHLDRCQAGSFGKRSCERSCCQLPSMRPMLCCRGPQYFAPDLRHFVLQLPVL